MKKQLSFFILVLCIGVAFNTCSKKTATVQPDNREISTPTQPLPEQTSPKPTKTTQPKPVPAPVSIPVPVAEPVQADNTDKEQDITIKTSIGDEVLQFDTILFDYNSYDLRPDAIAKLEKTARLLKKNPTAIITIEGHCDERGTVEYNLALGERRAYSVKTYFIEYGLNSDNLITISYGKEKPVDPGHDEDAWSKNRRAALSTSDPK